MYILIPSARIVDSGLRRLGELPPIIYPLNDGIVFDYLWKQYEKASDSLDIICYENAEKVHRRLQNYASEKIRILDLPVILDLGHTIYYGLKDSCSSVVINFADTIVFDNILSREDDSFFYSEDYVSETWTYFRMDQGRIREVIDKHSVNGNKRHKEKLFVGVFRFSDSGYFRYCLERAFDNPIQGISSFYQALMYYSEKYVMHAKETENWFDIGHEDKYYNSKLEVDARSFNHIKIDSNRGILTKTSDDHDKLTGEIRWYLKLPAAVEYVRPRIFNYSTSSDGVFISMEYYSYHTLHELFLYGDLRYHQWTDIFERVRFVCNDFGKYILRDGELSDALKDVYLKKTLKRLEMLKESNVFSSFFHNKIYINGICYPSLDEICQLIKIEVPRELFDVNEFRVIHGDLCFTNILVDSNFSFIKLIDPRGKFGKYDIYGDFRYELAKLFHSMDGKYDFIIKDLFTVEFDMDLSSINYTIQDRLRDYDIFDIFKNVFRKEIGDDLKKIEFIEALLFLSMIPLHSENVNHQMVMLGTGIEILDRLFDIKENKGNLVQKGEFLDGGI